MLIWVSCKLNYCIHCNNASPMCLSTLIRIENLTNDPLEDYSPSWSPDGNWIAYTKGNSENYDVWVINVNTKIKHRLTTQPKRDESPFWKN
mgnify:CR=1 FL=1